MSSEDICKILKTISKSIAKAILLNQTFIDDKINSNPDLQTLKYSQYYFFQINELLREYNTTILSTINNQFYDNKYLLNEYELNILEGSIEIILLNINLIYKVELSTIVISLIYLDRLINSKVKIRKQNLREFLLGCLLVAIKYNEDDNFNKISGIKKLSLYDISIIEFEVLHMNEYSFYVSNEIYFQYYNSIFSLNMTIYEKYKVQEKNKLQSIFHYYFNNFNNLNFILNNKDDENTQVENQNKKLLKSLYSLNSKKSLFEKVKVKDLKTKPISFSIKSVNRIRRMKKIKKKLNLIFKKNSNIQYLKFRSHSLNINNNKKKMVYSYSTSKNLESLYYCSETTSNNTSFISSCSVIAYLLN